MKSLKNSLLLLLAVVMTNASVVLADTSKDGDNEPDAQVSVKQLDASNKQALIRITNLTSEGPAILRIKDTKGYVLHKEVLKQNDAYAKKYDLSSLPNGEYLVELKTKQGTIEENFSLASGQTNTMYFKPAVQIEPGLVKVAFMNRVEAPVSLKLYNNRGEVLYEESVDSQETYSKGLNVSKLDAGQYSLAILGDNYVFSRSIEIK